MYTFEEYQKASSLGSLMTGTVMGYIKYSGLPDSEKKLLAKQLLWCYETSGQEISETTKKEIEEILG
tara:strand:+ start:519 stop:719 length:201 start_codon:yes stop_codon:yes gene_type:complete